MALGVWRNTKTVTEVHCTPSGVKPIVSIHRGIGYKIRLSCRTVSFPGCRTGRCGWLPARSGKRDAVTIVESYLTMVHFVTLWKSLVPFLGQSQLLFLKFHCLVVLCKPCCAESQQACGENCH